MYFLNQNMSLFSCSEVEEIKNNQFDLKIHILTENMYVFCAQNKLLSQLAQTFSYSNLNEKYELTFKQIPATS